MCEVLNNFQYACPYEQRTRLESCGRPVLERVRMQKQDMRMNIWHAISDKHHTSLNAEMLAGRKVGSPFDGGAA